MIINGKEIAEKIYSKLKKEVDGLKVKPSLGIILVGNNPASLRYIEQKKKWAKFTGIKFELNQLSDKSTQQELLKAVEDYNKNSNISGFMVQLPLPKGLDTKKIINAIDPLKDVDGFNPNNIGKLMVGDENGFSPCTPAGIMDMIDSVGIDLQGKIVTVLGRSNIVGKPVTALLINAGATVVSCNSKTPNIGAFTSMSDIVITAAGKPGVLTLNMLKLDTVVIDVGFSVIEGKIHGDADFKNINLAGNKITPVPGGVGALTVAMLMKNTVKASKINT